MESSHSHSADDTMVFPSMRRIDVCRCGATREVDAKGVPGPWHTCGACTHPFGLVAA